MTLQIISVDLGALGEELNDASGITVGSVKDRRSGRRCRRCNWFCTMEVTLQLVL